jgi:hypothetical protein
MRRAKNVDGSRAAFRMGSRKPGKPSPPFLNDWFPAQTFFQTALFKLHHYSPGRGFDRAAQLVN